MRKREGKIEEKYSDIYCPKCGHCGEIGCCGVTTFFEHHVRGKTNCLYEEEIISEIIEMLDFYKEKNNV